MPKKKYLNGREAAELARQLGFPLSHRTLAKYRCTGGGPEAHKFGRYVVYDIDLLLPWFFGRLSKPQRSSSDIAKHPPS